MPALDHDLDRLYRLPLTQFVESRNALAASLKKTGDADAAKRVRALPKPSASAWAINQLYWTARPRFDELIAAGDRYRRAQKAALAGDGSELADAERDRRLSIDEAVRTSLRILGESDPSPSLLRRIQTTLEALASLGSDNPNPLNGRLTEDLEATGFGALSSLAPPPEQVSTRMEKEALQEEEALAAAKDVLAKATARAELQSAALAAAKAALLRAEEEADRATAEAEQAKATVAKLEEARRRRGNPGKR
jgi:hypothetical protein